MAAVVRVLLIIVLPLGVLGFVWGWSERYDLERWATQSSDRLKKGINRYSFRQTGKAIVCGVLFAFFHYEIGFVPYRTWDTTENIIADISTFTAPLLVAALVGLIVGAITRRNLVRRLSYDRAR
jgi:hypothetical protein